MNNRKYIDCYTNKVKSNRHVRFLMHKKKLINLINKASNYPTACFWSETYSEYILPDAEWRLKECGKDYPTSRAYPKRYWRDQRSEEIKRICNRKFRRKKIEINGKSNIYRHYTEFWWEYD